MTRPDLEQDTSLYRDVRQLMVQIRKLIRRRDRWKHAAKRNRAGMRDYQLIAEQLRDQNAELRAERDRLAVDRDGWLESHEMAVRVGRALRERAERAEAALAQVKARAEDEKLVEAVARAIAASEWTPGLMKFGWEPQSASEWADSEWRWKLPQARAALAAVTPALALSSALRAHDALGNADEQKDER